MAKLQICKLLISFSLLLLYLASSVRPTHGQVECDPEMLEPCDEHYYCDYDYRCKKCAQCENFETSNTSSCLKSSEQCGVCRDGYEFHSPGKCVEQYTLKIFLFWVGGASSTIILIIMVVAAVIFCIWKKNKASRTRYWPEDAVNGNSNVLLSPLQPSAPPPPYSADPQQPFNPKFSPSYNGSSKPIFKCSHCAQEIEMDSQQTANPCSNCVILPRDINSYNLERSMEEPENVNLNEDVDLEENVDDEAPAEDDALNNINLPAELSRSVSEPAEPEAESRLNMTLLAVRSDTSREERQDCNTEVGNIDRGHHSESDPSSPRSGSPAAESGGSQQLIVQFINNITPILNLQGNNTRR